MKLAVLYYKGEEYYLCDKLSIECQCSHHYNISIFFTVVKLELPAGMAKVCTGNNY